MPKHTTALTLLALAMTALPLVGAGPAAAQHTIGFQYNLMTAGEVGKNLNGVAVDFDTPVYGDLFTVAAGGAFVTTSGAGATISQAFFGAGPGVRHDAGRFEIYAHALFGYRRDSAGGLLRGEQQRVRRPLRRRHRLPAQPPLPLPRRSRLRRQHARDRRHGRAVLTQNGQPRHWGATRAAPWRDPTTCGLTRPHERGYAPRKGTMSTDTLTLLTRIIQCAVTRRHSSAGANPARQLSCVDASQIASFF